MSFYESVILAESGLLNFWRMTDASTGSSGGGNDLIDPDPDAFPMTFGAAVTFTDTGMIESAVDGIVSKAAKFLRASAATSYAAADPATLTGAHSFEFYFKIASGTITTGWYVLGTRGTAGGGTDISIGTTGTGRFVVNLHNGTTSYTSGNVGTDLPRDTWMHCVLTVTAAGVWILYVNGLAFTNGTWALSGTPQVFDTNRKLTIGNYNRSFDVNWAGNVWMQYLSVWNRVLTPLEVATHYAASRSPMPPLYIGELGPELTAILLMPAVVADPGGGADVRPTVGQTWPR